MPSCFRYPRGSGVGIDLQLEEGQQNIFNNPLSICCAKYHVTLQVDWALSSTARPCKTGVDTTQPGFRYGGLGDFFLNWFSLMSSNIQKVFHLLRLIVCCSNKPFVGWPYIHGKDIGSGKGPCAARRNRCLFDWIWNCYEFVSWSSTGMHNSTRDKAVIHNTYYAQILDDHNISVTVADARFCKPLDTDLIERLAKVCKTSLPERMCW